VRRPDGTALANVPVILISADDSWFTTFHADQDGHFRFGNLKPGAYVVGINLPGAAPWEVAVGGGVPPPPASLYYGGAADRSSAVAVKLGDDEKRDNLDFIVP